MDVRDVQIARLEAMLKLRVWIGAVIGLPLAVGTGLALVFFMRLAEPVPADSSLAGYAAASDDETGRMNSLVPMR